LAAFGAAAIVALIAFVALESSASAATARTAARISASAWVYEYAARARIQHRRNDLRGLLRRLPRPEDGLRRALAQLTVEIDVREPQLAKRQRGEPAQRVSRIDAPLADVLQHGRDFVAHPRHERHDIAAQDGSD